MSKHSSRGPEWEALRQQVFARAGGICEEPSCNAQATHVDHIYPKALGGTDDLDNLQALCGPHNLRKGAKVTMRTNYMNTDYFS